MAIATNTNGRDALLRVRTNGRDALLRVLAGRSGLRPSQVRTGRSGLRPSQVRTGRSGRRGLRPSQANLPSELCTGVRTGYAQRKRERKRESSPTPPIREKDDLPPSHLASLHTARARGGMRSANLRRGARLRSEGQARIRCRCVLGLLRDSRLDGSRFPRLQLEGAHARMGAQTGPLEARRAEARGSGG